MISRHLSWLGPLIGIALIGAGVYFFVVLAPDGKIPTPMKLVDARKVGDFQTTVAELDSITGDTSKSEEEKAIATYVAAGARFHLSGDVDDRLTDIQEIKKVVLNENISLQSRVNALNVLAASYGDSGRDPVVFAELYKDEPFRQYFVEKDPELSARKLYEWSYSMKPTAVAAARISKWYAEQYVFNPKQTAQQTAEYAALAVDWLNKADAASLAETRYDPTYAGGSRYIEYRHWKAVNIGRISRQIPEPYGSMWRTAYNDYIDLLKSSDVALAKENIFYARFTYALRLMVDKDTAGAKVQFDELANMLNALSNPDTVAYVRFLRNTYENQPDGSNWVQIRQAYGISPAFKTAVEKIIATTPAKTTTAPAIPTNDNY